MTKAKPNNQINRTDITLFLFDKCYSLASIALRYGIPAWAAVEIAEILAGKTTLANIALSFAQSNSDQLQYLVWGILILWALAERWLRKQKTRYLHRRVLDCEKRLDPNRSSSHLTEAGDTNPEDR